MAVIDVTIRNFDEIVLRSKKPVLIEFYTHWCGSCAMLEPIIEEIADEYDGAVIVGRVDVDNEPGLASQLSIDHVPTLMYFQRGVFSNEVIGYYHKKKLERLLGLPQPAATH